MSVTKKTYTAAEKAKIALEAIKGELSVAQISSQYGVACNSNKSLESSSTGGITKWF